MQTRIFRERKINQPPGEIPRNPERAWALGDAARGTSQSINNKHLCTIHPGQCPTFWLRTARNLSVHDVLDEILVGDVPVSVLEWPDEELGLLLVHDVSEVGHDLSELTAEHHLVALTIETLEHLYEVGVVGDGGSFLELLVDGDEGGEVDTGLVELGVLEDFLHVGGERVEGEGLQELDDVTAVDLVVADVVVEDEGVLQLFQLFVGDFSHDGCRDVVS